jgi:hypothetical protein
VSSLLLSVSVFFRLIMVVSGSSLLFFLPLYLLWADETRTLKALTPWSLCVLDQFIIVRIVEDADAMKMFKEEEVWLGMEGWCAIGLQGSMFLKVFADVVHSTLIIPASIAMGTAIEFYRAKCANQLPRQVPYEMRDAMRDPFCVVLGVEAYLAVHEGTFARQVVPIVVRCHPELLI